MKRITFSIHSQYLSDDLDVYLGSDDLFIGGRKGRAVMTEGIWFMLHCSHATEQSHVVEFRIEEAVEEDL